MILPRVLFGVLVACLVTAAAVVGISLARDEQPSAAPAALSAKAAPAAEVEALKVLQSWDTRRAAAWASGDVRALQALYQPRSTAGERDVAMLQKWVRRGLTVRGLTTQVLSLEVRSQSADRLVVEVTDRIASATARGPGVRQALPQDRPSARVITLVQDGGWLVQSVVPINEGSG